jgi:hypothetical protein
MFCAGYRVVSFFSLQLLGKSALGRLVNQRKKKGEYHIYEQFKRSQKNIESPPQQEKDISSPLLESMLFLVPSETVGEIFFQRHQDLLLCHRLSFATRGKKQPVRQPAQEPVRRNRFCTLRYFCHMSAPLARFATFPLQ